MPVPGVVTRRLRLLAVFWLLTIALPVFADGPHISFHGTEGALTVTLFSAPDPLVAGPVGLTLLVQRAGDGSLVSDASASGELALRGHAPVAFLFKKGGSGNQQLQGTTVPLKLPGQYALRLRVSRPGVPEAAFQGSLPVEVNNGQRNTVLWAVVLPAVFLLLFLANQHAKLRLRRQGVTWRPDGKTAGR